MKSETPMPECLTSLPAKFHGTAGSRLFGNIQFMLANGRNTAKAPSSIDDIDRLGDR